METPTFKPTHELHDIYGAVIATMKLTRNTLRVLLVDGRYAYCRLSSIADALAMGNWPSAIRWMYGSPLVEDLEWRGARLVAL